jgi:GAF domain-containing protein
MSADASESTTPGPPQRGEPLVPLLRAEQGLDDPDALATWHAALSNALSSDLPHDLLALWLYPWHGGSVLLGPEALAQDDLAVPLPSPQVDPGQVELLEDIVRDAGYGSVACVPVRTGRRDVGLVLAADLQPDRYGEGERLTLEVAAQRLAPMLGRMARQWGAHAHPAPEAERMPALVDAVGSAGNRGGSPQVYLAELGRALEAMLPHDALELLLADPDGSRAYRLSEHTAGPLWADPSLVIAREHLDLGALFGDQETVRIPDTYQDPRWPRGYFTVEEPVGAELRAIVGTRLRVPGVGVAYLLAGGVGADLYADRDAELLRRVGSLIAAQVAVLVAAAVPAPAKPQAPEPPQPSLLEAAELLATGTEFAETTRRVADLAGRVLPFDEIRFAIRLSEGDRVVLLEPGERRPLPDLPLVPVAGTTLAAVLQGEIPSSFQLVQGEARLLVPLRVAGRVHGALVLTARPPAILREAHVLPAQQLADIVAAHLELLRRTALLPAPYMPGWKKVR